MEDLEHGTVEELAALIASGRVELFGVSEQVGDGDLHAHLGLPLLQNVDGHGVGHIGVEQLRLVTFELSEASALVGDESAAGVGGLMNLVAGAAAERGNLFVGETNGRPLPGDDVIDFQYR